MLSGLWGVGLLGLAILAIFYGLRRANELFALSARAGKLKLTRGRLPPPLFSELAEIVARARLDAVDIRAVSEAGKPRLLFTGTRHGAAEQAARNVLGRYDVSQIRAGSRRAG